MRALDDALDRFAGEHGAAAHGAVRDVLRAVLDEFATSIDLQVAAGTDSVDALHIASMATVARIARVLDVDLETVVENAVLAGLVPRVFGPAVR